MSESRPGMNTPKPSSGSLHADPNAVWLIHSGVALRSITEKAPTRLPGFTATMWWLFCCSTIFAVQVPGLHYASTTIFALPCMLFAFMFLRQYQNNTLLALCILLIAGVWLSAIGLGIHNSVYFNFAFWITNAYAAYRLLVHPHGQRIAINAWVVAVSVFTLGRVLNLMHLASFALFDRNGFGFFISIFMAPLYLAIREKTSSLIANLFLFTVFIVLLVNASRSGILVGFFVIVLLQFLLQRSMQPRLTSLLLFLMAFGGLTALTIPYLATFSPVLGLRVEWVEAFLRTGDTGVRSGGGGSTVLLREYLANKSIELYKLKPETGVGFSQYAKETSVPAQEFLTQQGLGKIIDHNAYLLWLAETGLFGTIPLALFLLYTLRHVWKSFRLYVQSRDTRFVICICIILATLLQLNFLSNLTASGTWVILISAAAFNDGYSPEN